MSAPTNFVLGIVSTTYTPQGGGGVTVTSVLRVGFNDETPLSGEGYDDDTSWTQTWSGPHHGRGTITCRDPAQVQALKGLGGSAGVGGTLVVVGQNRNSGGSNKTHTFSAVTMAQPGGDIPGGAQAPESVGINFNYGDLTIT